MRDHSHNTVGMITGRFFPMKVIEEEQESYKLRNLLGMYILHIYGCFDTSLFKRRRERKKRRGAKHCQSFLLVYFTYTIPLYSSLSALNVVC